MYTRKWHGGTCADTRRHGRGVVHATNLLEYERNAD